MEQRALFSGFEISEKETCKKIISVEIFLGDHYRVFFFSLSLIRFYSKSK